MNTYVKHLRQLVPFYVIYMFICCVNAIMYMLCSLEISFIVCTKQKFWPHNVFQFIYFYGLDIKHVHFFIRERY